MFMGPWDFLTPSSPISEGVCEPFFFKFGEVMAQSLHGERGIFFLHCAQEESRVGPRPWAAGPRARIGARSCLGRSHLFEVAFGAVTHCVGLAGRDAHSSRALVPCTGEILEWRGGLYSGVGRARAERRRGF